MKVLGPDQGSNPAHLEYEAVKVITRALRAVRLWEKHAFWWKQLYLWRSVLSGRRSYPVWLSAWSTAAIVAFWGRPLCRQNKISLITSSQIHGYQQFTVLFPETSTSYKMWRWNNLWRGTGLALTEFWCGDLKEICHLEDVGVNWRIILKRDLYR
jgi:hypothetical protein